MNKDFVRRYAMLQLARESQLARGWAVPPQIQQEIAQMENVAKVRMSPQQIQAALQHVEVAKLQLRQESAEQVAQQRQRVAQTVVDRTVGSMTAGMLGRTGGLTRAELDLVAAGKALPGAKRLTQEQRDEVYRQQTRRYDPAGRGWSEAEWTKRLDELAEADADRYSALATQYRAQPHELRSTVERWKGDRYEHGLRKRREAADGLRGTEPLVDRPPNYEERRRASLVKAYAQHTGDAIEEDTLAGRSDAFDEFNDRVSDELKNEKQPDGQLTRRAQIARAFEQHVQEAG